jgi:SNF2 family DNA or RNA helicase
MNLIQPITNKKYRPHQLRVIPKIANNEYFGLFHDMGSGKTLSMIAGVQLKHSQGLIDSHIVFVPATIIPVWEEQYNSDWDSELFEVWGVTKVKSPTFQRFLDKETHKLKVIVTSIEGLSQGNSFEVFFNYMKNSKCHMTIDESTSIKTHNSARTKRAIKLGQLAVSRGILTGTPSTNGLHDLFAQMYFLHPDIIGCKSYFVFKNRYCIMGGFEGRKIIGYMNEDELMNQISDYVDIQKIERQNFPPQNYQVISCSVSPEQNKLIKQLEQEYIAIRDIEQSNGQHQEITPTTALERLTRFQQILGGSFPYKAEDGQEKYLVERLKKVPKIDTLVELVQDIGEEYKIIIWARFVPEIQHIQQVLEKLNIGKVVTFYGQDDQHTRTQNSKALQEGDARILITNASGAKGQTWTAANYNIYFSNSYSYETREQSERRTWGRDDSQLPVFYFDLVAESKYDKVILEAIKHKKDVGEMVMDVIGGIQK